MSVAQAKLFGASVKVQVVSGQSFGVVLITSLLFVCIKFSVEHKLKNSINKLESNNMKILISFIMMGFLMNAGATADIVVKTTDSEAVPLSSCQTSQKVVKTLLGVTEENKVEIFTNEMAANSCNQCYIDHQVCIQHYSRPFCRQQLADCKESCNW